MVTPLIRTSVNVTPEFHELCKIHRIKFSDALRVGISIILAERGVKDYDNNLSLFRRMSFFKEALEKLTQKQNEIPEQTN